MADPAASASDAAAGAGTPPPAAGLPPATLPPDAAAIRAAVEAELAERHAAQLFSLTGHTDFAAAQAAKAAADAAALAEQGRYKELHEQTAAQLADVTQQFHRATIRAAVLAAASDAVDPDVVHDLLAASAVVGADSAVTVGGKPVADAVSALLAAKPYLAKPAGGAGSGAGAGGAAKPKAEGLTLRELGELKKSDPAAYAAELKRRAAQGK